MASGKRSERHGDNGERRFLQGPQSRGLELWRATQDSDPRPLLQGASWLAAIGCAPEHHWLCILSRVSSEAGNDYALFVL